jgi:hypothetical protein
METVRQQVDEILSGAAARQDWALQMLVRRDISQATMDEIVDAQTAILYGLIDAVRELANQLDARTK